MNWLIDKGGWFLLVCLFIVIASGIIWIKISDYFLSAVDIVHHSRYSYFIRKYVSGFGVGILLAIVFFFSFGDLMIRNKSDNNNTDISKSQSSQESKTTLNNNENKNLNTVTGLDCNSDNKIVNLICNDKELIEINNKYQNFGTSLFSKNVDGEKLKENRAELNRKLIDCNLNKQCIYFSFQEAIIQLESLSN